MDVILISMSNKLAKLNALLPRPLRRGILIIIFFVLGVLWILDPIYDFTKIGYVIAIIFMLTTLLSVNKEISELYFNRGLFLSLILLSASYIISSFIWADRTRLFSALFFLFLIPFSGVMLSDNENFKDILYTSSWGSVGSCIFLLVASFLYAPLFTGQYSSIVLNPNGLAQIVLPIIFSSIYLTIYYYNYNKESSTIWNKIRIIFLVFIFFACLSLLVFSRSRTGMLAVLVMLIGVAVYLFRSIERVLSKPSIFKILLAVIVGFISFLLVMNFLTFLLSNLSIDHMRDEIKLKGSARRFVSTGTHTFTEKDFQTDLAVEQVDQSNKQTDRNGESEDQYVVPVTADEQMKAFIERADKGLEEHESVDSGRLEIWSVVIRSLNLHGHDRSDQFYVTYSDKYISNTHNMFLSIGFLNGIPSMLISMMFILIYVLAVASIFIRRTFAKNLLLEDLYLFMIGATFVLVAMISGVYLPVASVHSFLFWQTIPLIKKEIPTI